MRGHQNKFDSADVVAVFETQDDADQAVLRLYGQGFTDRQIGYYAWHPFQGLTNLSDRSYAFSGSVVGGIVGAALGVGLAFLLNAWSDRLRDVQDLFGLGVTAGTFLCLFGGLIGWGIGVGIHRRGVEMPAVDPTVGPFILAVHAEGAARDLAWSIIRRCGGGEVPAAAMAPHPAMV
jgi:hypothetical protein